jgi:hypothetical protein
MIIGPMLGGLLSEPAEAYTGFDTPFFRRFPFSLPCFLVGLIAALATALNYAYLPETLRKACAEDEEQLLSTDGTTLAPRPVPVKDPNTPQDSSIRSLLAARNSRLSLLLYASFSFSAIGMDELHSVYCATPVALGGLGWTSQNIGWSLAVVGAVLITCQLVVYPALERRFKVIGAFKVCCVIVVLATLCYPMVNFLALAPLDVVDDAGHLSTTAPNETVQVWTVLLSIAITFKVSGMCGRMWWPV